VVVVSDQNFIKANRANWDDRVDGHLVAYGAEAFADSAGEISEVVREDLALMAPHLPNGSVDGLRLVHLQCHIGTDTISWARLGALATGLDFSPKSLEAARMLAERASVSIQFVESTIEDAPATLGETFDVVYTSIGVLPWLADLGAWARTVFELLSPGGLFFIRDGHPMMIALDYERTDGLLVVEHPYFETGSAQRFEDTTSYVGDGVIEHAVHHEWSHSLGEIIQSLLDAGLQLTSFAEQRAVPWTSNPALGAGEAGWMLTDRPERLPLTFSLTARRPH